MTIRWQVGLAALVAGVILGFGIGKWACNGGGGVVDVPVLVVPPDSGIGVVAARPVEKDSLQAEIARLQRVVKELKKKPAPKVPERVATVLDSIVSGEPSMYAGIEVMYGEEYFPLPADQDTTGKAADLVKVTSFGKPIETMEIQLLRAARSFFIPESLSRVNCPDEWRPWWWELAIAVVALLTGIFL